ncbi:hypothetical protein PHLGIDRAFT_37634 [Phlebiopsis gigantea 11061_1 CR5-6]|uniref:Uncharacterized protein n=1 Tax=Phlebiopsis gigantea (strain 11061_1 CR5-6) TaxID=745531 RepID=A0A0C3S199_PHLG1|nr:hypothetical protein PHLGIDRAFT_37634 [Phlebiopsis gigantea 11061_1 CR5-6]
MQGTPSFVYIASHPSPFPHCILTSPRPSPNLTYPPPTMPRHPMPYAVESEASPSPSPASSLKHSPSKREKVRKFLRRVSSIGQRNKQGQDQTLSQTFAAAETQASGSERGASTPDPHTLIDLTTEPVTPAKVPRRASTSSSILRHKAGRLTADDGSSFHSSSPSESSAEDALSLTSAHKQHATSATHVEPEVPSTDEPTLEASPDQREAADAAAQDAPAEANPVPPVFLSAGELKLEAAPAAEITILSPVEEEAEVDRAIPAPADAAETAPTQQEDPEPAAASVLLAESYELVNPFDDAYAADAESDASASPALEPVAGLDNEDVDQIELNTPEEAPLPASAPACEPASPNVEVSPSPECTVEVSAPEETIDSACAEPQTMTSPSEETLHAAPALSLPNAHAPVAAQPTPSVSSPASPPSVAFSAAFSAALYPAPARPAPLSKPAPEPTLSFDAPPARGVVALLHSGLTALRQLVSGRAVRGWRSPVAYSLVVACYSLTWWLHRRPPADVPVGFFQY